MAHTPFADRVALVTGGGSGIGAAISRELAKKGAKVVVSDLNHKNAEKVVQEITDVGGTAVAFVADASSREDNENLVKFAVDNGAYTAAKHPMQRLGTAAEVSALTCFLLSDEASFITGGHHLEDGGYTVL